MKKFLLVYVTLFFTILLLMPCFDATAQGIYQFWGTTSQGMEGNAGTLFSTKSDGTGHKIRPAFTFEVSGRGASAQVPVAFNNKLYGMMRYGGMRDHGIIYEYDPATGIYKKVFDLYYVDGERPQGNLVLRNGKMYGMTADGGSNDYGVLFEFDPVTYNCVKKKEFNIGSSPYGDLTWFNNKFYGLLRFTGASGGGGLFEYDPVTNEMAYKMDFNEAIGKQAAWWCITTSCGAPPMRAAPIIRELFFVIILLPTPIQKRLTLQPQTAAIPTKILLYLIINFTD